MMQEVYSGFLWLSQTQFALLCYCDRTGVSERNMKALLSVRALHCCTIRTGCGYTGVQEANGSFLQYVQHLPAASFGFLKVLIDARNS